MKLLFVIDTLGAGGSEKSQMMVLDFLYKKGISFDLVLLKRADLGFEQIAIDRGYPILVLDHFSFAGQVRRIIQLVNEQKYDLVHSVLFNSNIRVRLARLFTRFIHLESLVSTPYSPVRFSDPKLNKFKLTCYQWIDRITAQCGTDYYHSVNEAVKHHYVSCLNIKPEKIHVVYRGRNHQLFGSDSSASRSEFGFGEYDFVIVNSGRHEFAKGQIYLLRAVNLLVKKGYTNIKLLIIGREGESTSELKRFISDHELEEYIKLAGFRHDVPNVLKMADLFAFPSVYEGTAGALLEAAASSLPIALNRIESVREVVLENVNACFFDIADIDSIANTILSFYNNPEKCREFGKAGRNFFMSRFTEEASNSGMMDLYNRLVNQKKPNG